eukprot:PhF_6_TR12992/c0_g1_i1/m.20553
MNLEGVARTNDDATLRKLHAVQRGYWKDDTLPVFASHCHSTTAVMANSPLMNRGFWLRVNAFYRVAEAFISQVGKGGSVPHQVISIGAGFDTLFYRLQHNQITTSHTTWVEVDLPHVMHTKEKLAKKIVTTLPGAIHFIGCDITQVQETFESILRIPNISKDVPTLFICECVLVYLDPAHSDALITTAHQTFPNSCFVTYDAIRGDDAFGTRMCESL